MVFLKIVDPGQVESFAFSFYKRVDKKIGLMKLLVTGSSLGI